MKKRSKYKKIHDTSKFIETHELNILTEINFNARITEVSKSIATKKQVENALGLGDKNREKNKTSNVWFKLLYW